MQLTSVGLHCVTSRFLAATFELLRSGSHHLSTAPGSVTMLRLNLVAAPPVAVDVMVLVFFKSRPKT